MFFAANAGKRSLVLDLKALSRTRGAASASRNGPTSSSRACGPARPSGSGSTRRRCARRGTPARSLHPRRLRSRPARRPRRYDPLMQAFSGILSDQGRARGGRRPRRRLARRLRRRRVGGARDPRGAPAARPDRRGRDRRALAARDGALARRLPPHAVPARRLRARRHGTAFPLIAPYEVFATSDGALMIAAANDRLFRSLCAALDEPSLADDARFATNPLRLEHRVELIEALAERIAPPRDRAAARSGAPRPRRPRGSWSRTSPRSHGTRRSTR